MKKIFKQKLVLLFLLIVGIGVVVNSCQQDDVLHEHDEASHVTIQQKEVSVGEIPQIMEFINSKKNELTSSGNLKNNSTAIDSISLSHIIQIISNTGVASYTFSIGGAEESTLSNLVVYSNNGVYNMYITKYTPTNLSDFLDNVDSIPEENTYSGKLEILNINGEIVDTKNYVNGVEIKNKNTGWCNDFDLVWRCFCENHTPENCNGCASGGRFLIETTLKPCGQEIGSGFTGGGGGGDTGSGGSTIITTPNINYKTYFRDKLPIQYDLVAFNLPHIYKVMDAFGKYLYDNNGSEISKQFITWATNYLLNQNNWNIIYDNLSYTNQPLTQNFIKKLINEFINFKLETNPILLTDIPCDQFWNWMNIYDYQFPQSIYERVEELDMSSYFIDAFVQDIKDAQGPVVNMDFFSITITQLPFKPNANNVRYTASEVFDFFRKNLNLLLQGTTTSFSAYDDTEATKWQTENYLNTIMRFDIVAGTLPLNGIPIPITQDGTVICVEQNGSVLGALESKTWKFATIYSPEDYNHPVSGVREFGYYKDTNDNYVFFTRGLDRLTETTDDMGASLSGMNPAFEGADVLWNKFQQNFNTIVNNGGGVSVINADYISRPNWSDVLQVCNGNKPINELANFDADCID